MSEQDSSDDRNDRIIHARVPEDLDRELKRKATRLGLSVSNLVRNVLLNAFGLVEDVVADSAAIARSARPGAGPAPGAASETTAAPAVPTLLGWQELVLALNAVCDHCNELLPKGTPAVAAVHDRPGARRFLCRACYEKEVSR